MNEEREQLPVAASDSDPSKSERWADIKAIFEAALTLESTEWASFLDFRCNSDEDLRREVESLLAAHDSDLDFLDEPLQILQNVVLTEEDDRPTFHPGTRIGAYQLDREIGRGGMGTVYLAHRADQEFEHEAAIKLVQVEKYNELAVKRFRHERQILARLEHPYIARLLDGGTTEEGIPYFVMEFVRGEVLTSYCDSADLSTRERIELFAKICAAVQYAHEQNIIHRDIKPRNIVVTLGGVPKLLDFGIAKILEPEEGRSEAQATGTRLLTPAYASPEQLHGDPATVRSDVYSLGIVLYELLCGERPTLRTLQNHAGLGECNEGHLSPRLRGIVFNAIRLDPDDRYPSVAAFAADLQRYLDRAPPASSAAQESPERISIGILPFREIAMEGSDRFFSSALVDALITRLSKVERFSVRPTSTVLKYIDHKDSVRAGRELRVQYILEGTLHKDESRLRLNAQLVSTESGTTVWASQFEEGEQCLLSLEESLSEQIAYAVIPQLTGEEESQLKGGGTSNRRAHEAYLRGRFHWNRSAGEQEELVKALVYFMQAIDEDPDYAAAHAGVADYHLRIGLWGGLPPAETFAAAIAEAKIALRLEPRLAEAHTTLGFCLWAYERDYLGAEREFQLAIAHNPEYASAHHWFGLLNSARNLPELALVNLERAHKIDPVSPVIAAARGFVHYNARRFGDALELLLSAAKELRKSAFLQEMLTWTYLQTGELRLALAAGRRAAELGKRSPSTLAAWAAAERAAGNDQAAKTAYSELIELQKTRYVSGYDFATICLAAGDREEALQQLARAYDCRDWWLCWLGVDPRWDALRGERRFKELVTKTQPHESGRVPVLPRKKGMRLLLVAALIAVLVTIAVVTAKLERRKTDAAFADARFSKLTVDGTAAGLAVISQDGQSVAYTTGAGLQTAVWFRDLRSRRSQRLITMPGEISCLQFTADGARLLFQSYPTLRPFDRTLYVLPVRGAITPTVLMSSMEGPAAVSPDESRVALVRANNRLRRDELWISDRKGHEQILLTTRYPDRLSWVAPPAWSVDGGRIAYTIERPNIREAAVGLEIMDLKTGKSRRVESPKTIYVQHVAWAGSGGLTICAREPNSAFLQLWLLSLSGDAPVRLGSDVESYLTASTTTNVSALVSVQIQTLSNIYLVTPGRPEEPAQVTPGTGRYFDLAWMPDGKFLYASDSSGVAEIWIMNGDGSDAHQLTANAGLNWGPAFDPAGQFIAFHSNRSGSWQIWRTDLDGSHPVQMTNSIGDSTFARFTSDGKSILYQHADGEGLTSIWRVPKSGGAAVQLTKALTTHPVSSPKDGAIAAWYSSGGNRQDWKLAIFPREGGDPVKVFKLDIPVSPESQLGWTPSGDGLTFIAVWNGVYELFLQPINGGAPKRITNYSSGQIYSFDWSARGVLAYSHGFTSRDVVIAHQRDKDTQNLWNLRNLWGKTVQR